MPLLRSLLLLAALLGAPATAWAQLREGAYDLAGKAPDGASYAGSVSLRPAPGGAWLMAWQVGNARIVGLGILHGGVLAVAFETNGTSGVAAYDVDRAGRLNGSWTTGSGLGSEVLTPRAAAPRVSPGAP